MWARPPETFQPASATAEKERQRRLTSLECAQQGTVTAVTIADGEADIFDLFALPRRE